MDDAKRIVGTQLWTSILAPPMAWAVDVQTNIALQQYACANHAHWLLWVVTAVTLLVPVYGALLARRGMAADPSKRARFMGLGGLFVSASFFLAILSTAVALGNFAPCD
jgi:hypothetical protein